MIVLASGSPRRRQLLEMIGLEFRVVPPDVDEALGPSEQPEGYVTRLAREKATTVARRERGAIVLAADTTVVLRGVIFGKPASPEEAAEMLRQLEGRKHQGMTAGAGGGIWWAPGVSRRRWAAFTASPITVSSSRRSEPTLPANTSPKLMPIPMASSGRPCSFHFALSFSSAAS